MAGRAEYELLQKSTVAEKYQTRIQCGEYMPQFGDVVGGLYLDVIDDKSTTLGMVFGSV